MLHYSVKFQLFMSDLMDLSDLFPGGEKTRRYVSYSRTYQKGRERKGLSFYSVLMAPNAIEPENLTVITGTHLKSRRMKHWG